MIFLWVLQRNKWVYAMDGQNASKVELEIGHIKEEDMVTHL